MTNKLGTRSINSLKGIHPKLKQVVEKAITLSPQDFTVISGVRTTKEQQDLYAQGRTKAGAIVTNADGVRNKSNHQAKSDGFGYAVDIVPYPVDWNDLDKFKVIANAMQLAACELGVTINWGGDWKMKDFPHFELK